MMISVSALLGIGLRIPVQLWAVADDGDSPEPGYRIGWTEIDHHV
jgi:hypothetical protein